MPPLNMDYKLHNPKSQRNTRFNNFRNALQKCADYSDCCVDEDGSSEGVSEGGSSVSDAEGGSNIASWYSSTGGIWARLLPKLPPRAPPITPDRTPSARRIR